MTSVNHNSAAACLGASKRLVVKVGSAILCDANGAVRRDWLAGLAEDIEHMRAEGREVVIVTSGAVALGTHRLGLARPLRMEEKQAASAAGQIALAEAWGSAFASYNRHLAQVLLTLDDTENRRRYLTVRSTIRTLLDKGALPIFNENDTIATSEIVYGDNDRLAAHAAQITGADALVILSDVDGLYTGDPNVDPTAEHVPLVEAITPAIEASAAGPNASAGVGSGGMSSKIAAAKIAGGFGCSAIIAPGAGMRPLASVLEGGKATLFRPSKSRESARRQWIAGRLKPAGIVTIDEGAAKAVVGGKSLLPAGVTSIEGRFSRGDAVSVHGPEGRPFAQGLSSYSSDDLQRVLGRKSDEIVAILGYHRRPAVIEKHDLILR